jgi:hypothetical protein
MSQNTLVIPTSRSSKTRTQNNGCMVSVATKSTHLVAKKPTNTIVHIKESIHDVRWSFVTAVKILLFATLFTVLLSDVIGIYHRLLDVSAQREKADAKLQLRSCVYQRNPDSRIFPNKTEVKLILLAGFAECDEASAFMKTVTWRYVSAVTSTYSVCNSLSDCRQYLWSWAMYIGGFSILITWSSWAWMVPYVFSFVASRFNTTNRERPVYYRQVQQQQPIITELDDDWEDQTMTLTNT